MFASPDDVMRRALELARRGEGFVEPNPMVGCVLLKDQRIIGEGCHQRFGGHQGHSTHARRQQRTQLELEKQEEAGQRDDRRRGEPDGAGPETGARDGTHGFQASRIAGLPVKRTSYFHAAEAPLTGRRGVG